MTRIRKTVKKGFFMELVSIILIVALAAAYVIGRIRKSTRKDAVCGCGCSCSGNERSCLTEKNIRE
ncbi:MAG: FeoB-associated Cys-rich membrane protein [Acidobacteria bacterium]|nr:FeoB-associated Cys-rich membrane protein [Acidobacteriota bacterium]